MGINEINGSVPAIFLDRDGTIIEYYPVVDSADKVKLLPGAGVALAELSRLGFLLVVVTNQPEIEKGKISPEQAEAVNEELQRQLQPFGVQIDRFYICPHRFTEPPACRCRKPDIGMLKTAEAELGINLAGSFMVGDSTRDIQTGKNAGIPTILVLTGLGGQGEDRSFFDVEADYTVKDLAGAVEVVAKHR